MHLPVHHHRASRRRNRHHRPAPQRRPHRNRAEAAAAAVLHRCRHPHAVRLCRPGPASATERPARPTDQPGGRDDHESGVSSVLSASLFGACPCRRTGVHFAGTRAGTAPVPHPSTLQRGSRPYADTATVTMRSLRTSNAQNGTRRPSRSYSSLAAPTFSRNTVLPFLVVSTRAVPSISGGSTKPGATLIST